MNKKQHFQKIAVSFSKTREILNKIKGMGGEVRRYGGGGSGDRGYEVTKKSGFTGKPAITIGKNWGKEIPFYPKPRKSLQKAYKKLIKNK